MRWPKDPDISHKYPGRDIYISSGLFLPPVPLQTSIKDVIPVVKIRGKEFLQLFFLSPIVHFFLAILLSVNSSFLFFISKQDFG